ncbi:uridine transporter UriT [Pseudonocardia parietis]|uniref:MFS family permease n=1 Tax=Pseudonocardia parietis TaxID=570936 RepID=A0ABS4W065_9PSEU|nr:MFS transporter [Pseudonocardia parietis]MBP2369338.1 MFS family permease [Pseudonocardia parietis]
MTATDRRPVVTLIVAVLAACVAFQLNASMLSPALVTMARELGTDDATIGLSQTMFFTLAAMFSLFLPRLSDIAGRRRVLLVMLAVMLVGSAVAALAVSVEMLFAGRILQGITGPVVPIGLLMLRSEIADPRRYGAALGLITAVNGGVAGVDAILGGWLATHFGFRSIFWVIAATTVVALALVAVWGVESRPSAGTRMDWRGVAPLVVSVGALLMAFDEAGALAAANWPLVGGYGALAVVAFVVFWRLQDRTEEPLIATRYLRRRATWATLGTTLLTMTGVFAVVNGLVASLAQNTGAGFGLQADLTALALLAPYALIGWVVGPFAGRIAPVLGYRFVLRIGLAGSVAATLFMAFGGVRSFTMLVIATLVLGVTYAGIANIMLNGLGIVLSPPENPGMLPGLNAGAFNLGAGISFVVLPAVQVAVGGAEQASTAGYSAGMLVGAACTAGALAMSLLIPRPATAETGTPQPRELEDVR